MSDTMISAAAGHRRATWAPILLRLGLLVAAVGLLAASARLLGPWSPERLQGLLAAAGPFAPAAFVGLFVVLNTAGVPAPLLGAAGGLALGLVPGALATLAGMTAAACAQLLLARRLTGPSRAAVRLPVAHRLAKVLQGRGWLAVVALRLAPGPFSEANLAAGLTPLPVRSMAVGTLMGGAPKALGWAALGVGAIHLPAAPALVLAAAVVAGLALTVAWLRRRGQRPAAAHPEPAPPQQLSPTEEPMLVTRAATRSNSTASAALAWAAVLICALYAAFALIMASAAMLDWLDSGRQGTDRSAPPMFVLHAISGAVALLAGSLQLRLAARLLRNRRQLHRRIGQTYLWAAWITSLSSLAVAAFFDVSVAAKTMFATTSLLWFTTTTIGFLHIRQGSARQHREWMLRSFSLAFFFVTGSLWPPILEATPLPQAIGYPLALFLSWSLNLLAAEWWIRRTKPNDRQSLPAGPDTSPRRTAPRPAASSTADLP